MKKIICVLGLGMVLQSARAQSIADCIQQLALDYQKLAGMKNILQEMYQGYNVLSRGYSAVKKVTQGNFSLQEAFLDGLYLVSPTVRKYPRVAEIMAGHARLVSECRAAKQVFQSGGLSPGEWLSLSDIFDNLLGLSLDNLDALTLVMSDNTLRMGDAERLNLIDQLHQHSQEQLAYLRWISGQTTKLLKKRSAASADRQSVRQLHGLN